jgi:hypothetical protein
MKARFIKRKMLFRRYHAYSENRSAAHSAQHCIEISEAGQEGLPEVSSGIQN